MKKFMIGLLVTIAIVLLSISLRLITNPRSKTGDEIRNEILIETPIGSHEEDVREFIEQHNHWEIRIEWFGDEHVIDGRFRYGNTDNNLETRNIEVRMEQHRTGIISTRVSHAMWRFDEEGRLVNILVMVGNHQLYGWY